MLTVKEMPISSRPREKLRASGVTNLMDSELLAIILGSGGKGHDVLRLAAKVLPVIDGTWPNLDASSLEEVPGIGSAKASLLLAALEFARRRIRPTGTKIQTFRDVMPLLGHFADRKQEHFLCISLNGAHEVIATRVLTIGLVNSTPIHPREVFSDPLKDRACAIIVAHNHPSGDLTPSPSDLEVTKQLKASGELLGIRLLDHIIFSQRGFYSFQEQGKLDRL